MAKNAEPYSAYLCTRTCDPNTDPSTDIFSPVRLNQTVTFHAYMALKIEHSSDCMPAFPITPNQTVTFYALTAQQD
jgi:hypothetical protein